jgi:DNA-binding response OmpR family regulator
VHLAHLRRKLGSLHTAIRTVRGVGYIWMMPPAAEETKAHVRSA